MPEGRFGCCQEVDGTEQTCRREGQYIEPEELMLETPKRVTIEDWVPTEPVWLELKQWKIVDADARAFHVGLDQFVQCSELS